MAPISNRELALGSAFLVTGQAVQAVVGFAVNLVLVRYLLPEEFGAFALVLAGAALAFSLFSLRIGSLIFRASDKDFDDDRKDKYFTASLAETLIVSGGLLLWLAVSGVATGWEFALVGALGLRHWTQQNKCFFERSMPYRRLAVVETSVATAGHVLALVLVLMDFGWSVLFIREIFVSIIGLIGLAALGGVTIRPIKFFGLSDWRTLVSEARGMWLDAALEQSFDRFILLAVGFVGGVQSVGFFFQAQKLALIPHQFFMPLVSRVAGNWFGRTEDGDRRRKGRDRMLMGLAVPTFAMAAVCVLFADPLVPWLFGEPWRPAAGLLAAMAGVVAFLSLFEVLKAYCWITRQIRRLLVGRILQFAVAGAVVVLAAVGVLPGEIAVALGMSISLIVCFAVVMFLVRRNEVLGAKAAAS